jgi:hypothetical protein
MSTPKPGHIRCPTCLRSTPPAAFCTQCGTPIPESARTRPRGLDRQELEERVRRRPGEAAFRRGGAADEEGPGGYVPFQPEPEDALAARADEGAGQRRDNLPPESDLTRPIDEPVSRSWAASPGPEPGAAPPPADAWPEAEGEPEAEAEPEAAEPADLERDEAEPRWGAVPEERPPYPPEAYEEVPYGQPEDAYAYPYTTDDGRGGGGNALPIIGFVVLCVLALGVGAVLAGLLGGEEPVGEASPTPTALASEAPTSQAPSEAASQAPSPSEAGGTPPPSGEPVTFADGAVLSIQPCGSDDFRDEAIGRPEEVACQVDGSSVPDGEVWTFVVFNGAGGDDALRVRLLQNDQAEDEQEYTIDAVIPCGASCNGLIYGPHYVDLLAGEYELELYRDGEFADSATFVVED